MEEVGLLAGGYGIRPYGWGTHSVSLRRGRFYIGPAEEIFLFVSVWANVLSFVKQPNRWFSPFNRAAAEVGVEGFEDQHPVGSVIQFLKAISSPARFA